MERNAEALGQLSIDLKLTGRDAANIRALRLTITAARDDHGTSLLRSDLTPPEFKGLHDGLIRVELQNPARDASFLEIEGTADVFLPTKDPNATQRIESFLSHLDSPLVNAGLAQARVELTPLSKAGVKARSANQALASLLSGSEPSETSAVFEVRDPELRLFGLQLVGSDGREIPTTTGSSGTAGRLKVIHLDAERKLPPNAALLVTLRTPNATLTIPILWKTVPMP
jgi:hypothetical protein